MLNFLCVNKSYLYTYIENQDTKTTYTATIRNKTKKKNNAVLLRIR